MQTATQAFEQIQTAKPDSDLRICRRIEVGEAIHQGDVYMHRLPGNHPRGKELGTRQVAVGTSVGSRHVIEGEHVRVFEGRQLPEGVRLPTGFRESDLLGPVVVIEEGTGTLTHPEHAHHRLPAGCYGVTYQMDLATNQRVAD